MTDLQLAGVWLAVLAGGIAVTIVARAWGLAATYVRDLLHIGTGVWVLGWPFWSDPLAPIAIAAGAVVVVAAVPFAASHLPLAARFRDSVTGDDEHFGGLVVYTAAYAVMTAAGLLLSPFAAAAGLWALSFGDGIGGAVGRRFGRHRYRPPFGKPKSWEGSIAVALVAAAAIVAAAALFDVAVAPWKVATLAGVAALAEGVAPRGSDNAVVPGTVWAAAYLLT